ncbi:piRNA biogenesis protein EXD1-like [Dendropsophus ebraccatus]|uniref:piRNA biogenesis protein EXD1-like n=1 Tax=Dendropsophus ebraccatus TaxID=150705 RepID=UPI003831081D
MSLRPVSSGQRAPHGGEVAHGCRMDLVSEREFLSKLIGTNIRITTVHGCYQGELLHIDADRAIMLTKVKDLSTGKTSRGAKLFFGHVIRKGNFTGILSLIISLGRSCEVRTAWNLEKAETSCPDSPFKFTFRFTEETMESAEEPPAPFSKEQQKPHDECGGKLSLKDVRHALEPVEVTAATPHKVKESNLPAMNYPDDDEEINYVVIDNFQPRFGTAIRHLHIQKVLSVAAVAVNLPPREKLCFLQVATKSWVYIFDILLLGPALFKNGLQMVLEDKSILKVVHDCRWLGNILSQRYGVILSNIFDTQVADVYLFSMKTGGFLPNRTSTVKECFSQYLNLSPSQVSFLTFREQLVKDYPNIWCDRPLPTTALKLLALEVKHLLVLRSVMLDAMLADYTMLVDGYFNGYRQGNVDVFSSTETTANSQLPKELQHLSLLQQRRREKALKDYKVNSLGFLEKAQQ